MSINAAGTLSPDDLAEHSADEAIRTLTETVREQQKKIKELTTTVAEVQGGQAELQGDVEQLREEHAELQGDVEQLREEHAELQGDVEQLREEHAELREEHTETRHQQAQDRQRISEVEQDIEDVNPTSSAGENTTQSADTTPIERLAQSDDVGEVTDSVSAQRAVSLFRNMADWGVKTQKGRCLRPKDNPLQLLEADRGESLAWKQYYRAAKALERLSQGAVTFFDSDRHGKMLVLHSRSDVYERVVNGATNTVVSEGTA